MQRCLADNLRQRPSAIRDVEGMFNPPYRSPKKPSAIYGPAVFDAIMMGNRGRVRQNRGVQGQDTNRRHGISSAVLYYYQVLYNEWIIIRVALLMVLKGRVS